jgi:hypothetical protein
MSEYIKGPRLSEQELEAKLTEIRKNVAGKMDKWANRLQISMATKPNIVRVEGERWEEDGKTWYLQGGIKKSISLLEHSRMPHWCPRCSLPMNHRFDRKFYYLRGHCFNCNVEIEGQMRLDGTWEAFEKRMLRENEKAFLRDKIQENIDYIKNFRPPQAHFSDGRWEEIAPLSSFSELFERIEKDIEFMVGRLEQIQKEELDENGSVEGIVESCEA